jgi:hypothetical protein
MWAEAMTRLIGPDVVRGAAIIGMIVVHSTLFQYGRITEIDLTDPPLIVTIIGFLAMWSGLFALVSGAVNTYSSSFRRRPLRGLLLTGSLMLILGFVYFVYIGPALYDMEGGNHMYSLLDGIMKDGTVHQMSFDRVIYNSSLTMIGMNLMFIAAMSWAIGKMKDRTKAGYILGGISIAVLLISVVRIPLFEVFQDAFDAGNMPLAVPLAPFVNKNDPLLPYLGFGTFGMLMGLWLREGADVRMRMRAASIIGGIFVIIGVLGLFLLPDTMLERDLDYTWYSIMVFLFGAFILILASGIRVFDLASEEKRIARKRVTLMVRRFGTMALSIFFIETLLSDLLALIWGILIPGWSDDMGLTVAFGFFVLIVWALLLWAWEKAEYRFSIEWFVARWSRRLGKETEKDHFIYILKAPPGKL